MKFFSDIRYVDQFRRYSRSKSNVVRNRAEIWTFFGPPNLFLRGGGFQKLYARYHPYLASRRLEKFRENTPTSPEFIEVHTLNFKPNFKFLRVIFLWAASQLGFALGSLGQYLARLKISGRSIP